MRLRLILLLLAGLTFLSLTVGGYFYVSTLHSSLEQKTTDKSTLQAITIINRLSEFLSAHLKTVRVLAGLREIEEALAMPDEEHLLQVNNILDKFNTGLEVDVCYLMDIQGNTLASSNRHASDSFVGKNFAFRPYFRQALDGMPATYMALGSASAKRGAYYSYPVYDTVSAQPLGVVVIKASVERLEKEFSQTEDGIALMTDPNGIIFIASDKRLLLQAIWPLSPEATRELTESRQFGTGPWPWSGLTRQEGNIVTDKLNTRYEIFQQSVSGFPGWQVVYLRNAQAGIFPMVQPLFKATGAVVMVFILLFGALVYILYLNASSEHRQRRAAEDALRENECRLQSVFDKTPALLQSFDGRGTLLSVSDSWLEAMGYSRDEVVGHPFTDYLAAAARDSPAREILESLEKKGVCNNIACQFLQKNGKIMDTLFSAFAERDAQGKIRQSLAVLADVTEQKKTALLLKAAQRQLSGYARALEGQVRERTRELNNIL